MRLYGYWLYHIASVYSKLVHDSNKHWRYSNMNTHCGCHIQVDKTLTCNLYNITEEKSSVRNEMSFLKVQKQRKLQRKTYSFSSIILSITLVRIPLLVLLVANAWASLSLLIENLNNIVPDLIIWVKHTYLTKEIFILISYKLISHSIDSFL